MKNGQQCAYESGKKKKHDQHFIASFGPVVFYKSDKNSQLSTNDV